MKTYLILQQNRLETLPQSQFMLPYQLQLLPPPVKMTDEPIIDGCRVEVQELRSKGRASACQICDFRDWEPGDVKFVIEHWANDDCCHDMHGCREHLCPTCAIQQGLPLSFYRQNLNAPSLDSAALAKLSDQVTNNETKWKTSQEALSNAQCDSCGRLATASSVCPHEGNQNQRTLLGFIVAREADSSVTCLCLACAVEKDMVELPKISESSKKRKEH